MLRFLIVSLFVSACGMGDFAFTGGDMGSHEDKRAPAFESPELVDAKNIAQQYLEFEEINSGGGPPGMLNPHLYLVNDELFVYGMPDQGPSIGAFYSLLRNSWRFPDDPLPQLDKNKAVLFYKETMFVVSETRVLTHGIVGGAEVPFDDLNSEESGCDNRIHAVLHGAMVYFTNLCPQGLQSFRSWNLGSKEFSSLPLPAIGDRPIKGIYSDGTLIVLLVDHVSHPFLVYHPQIGKWEKLPQYPSSVGYEPELVDFTWLGNHMVVTTYEKPDSSIGHYDGRFHTILVNPREKSLAPIDIDDYAGGHLISSHVALDGQKLLSWSGIRLDVDSFTAGLGSNELTPRGHLFDIKKQKTSYWYPNTPNDLLERTHHSSLVVGNKLIVWGGCSYFVGDECLSPLNSGVVFNGVSNLLE